MWDDLHLPQGVFVMFVMLDQAVSTWMTSDGCEACRRTCGGHGYSLLSGLPSIFTNYVQNVTWEGDNNVMCLQVNSPAFWT
jgi:hypothetical protein